MWELEKGTSDVATNHVPMFITSVGLIPRNMEMYTEIIQNTQLCFLPISTHYVT